MSEGLTVVVMAYDEVGSLADVVHRIREELESLGNIVSYDVGWRVMGGAPHRSYWLSQDAPEGGSRVVVELKGQEIHVLEFITGRVARLKSILGTLQLLGILR